MDVDRARPGGHSRGQTRTVIGPLPPARFAHDRERGPPGRGYDADGRHDEEHAQDARDGGAGRDGHEHDGWMDVDGAAVHERADDIALDDVEDDGPDAHDHDVRRDCPRRRR